MATDGQGRWLIGTASEVSLLELAQLLAAPDFLSKFRVDRALNLDGGPSTGIWIRDADGAEHPYPPRWPVRNYIAVIPR